jgi:hypothetical protein
MAEFVHQYVGEILKRQHILAQTYPDVINTDPMLTDRTRYSMNLQAIMFIGVIMKVISEVAPQVTDQVWLNALDHALDASDQNPWPDWILNQDPNMGQTPPTP